MLLHKPVTVIYIMLFTDKAKGHCSNQETVQTLIIDNQNECIWSSECSQYTCKTLKTDLARFVQVC
jgi:hypothetical protein